MSRGCVASPRSDASALPRPRDPGREEAKTEDERHAGDEQGPRLRQAELRVEEVRDDAARRHEPGEHGARDHRDAADVGERDELERDEDPEAVDGHLADA